MIDLYLNDVHCGGPSDVPKAFETNLTESEDIFAFFFLWT